jgi:hypothetical protein
VIVFHARHLQPRGTGDFDAKQFAGRDLDGPPPLARPTNGPRASPLQMGKRHIRRVCRAVCSDPKAAANRGRIARVPSVKVAEWST